MSSIKAAVVIPIYKAELNPLEEISLAQCRKVLGRYPLIFVAPEGKNFSYVAPNESVVQFPPQHFQSVASYSRLMLSPDFYETFADFDYILIHQLDAFVFYDALEIFCRLGYDYIGAPWPRYVWRNPLCNGKTPRVGNGGFSLRNVRAFHEILSIFGLFQPLRYVIEDSVEDGFFATCGMLNTDKFHVAPVEVAEKFSMEWYPDRAVKKLGDSLPFGCHNWHRFGADFYVEIFAQLGYDLRPFRARMLNNDRDFQTRFALEILATRRLIRRIERGQSISRYLPTKNFASVRVVRSSDTLKILSRLLWEDVFAEKIFIRDAADTEALLYDMRRENLPHLLIASENDSAVIAELERRGLIYGEHVISFRREYLRHCEELFHNLGR